jgi:hypothetical protein
LQRRGGSNLVADTLGSDLPLELGKGQKHVEGQPAHRGRSVELLGDRDKRHAMRVEQLDQLGKIGQRSCQAVKNSPEKITGMPLRSSRSEG